MFLNTEELSALIGKVHAASLGFEPGVFICGDITAGDLTKLALEADSMFRRIQQYRAKDDAIGKVLDPIRKKRETGEPARSDREEIEELVFIKTLYLAGG